MSMGLLWSSLFSLGDSSVVISTNVSAVLIAEIKRVSSLVCVALSQASSIENKQDWIKHIREVIQERTVHLRGALKEPIHIPKATPAKHKGRR